MKIGVLVPAAFVALFACSAVFADNTISTTEKGPWVGVIEDIQDVDVDSQKWAEIQNRFRIISPLTVHPAVAPFSLVQELLERAQVNNRDYLISFKDEADGVVKGILVNKVLTWNVGDKIRVTREEGSNNLEVETLEMGELSRYQAERAAERGEK